ncbi:transposase, MuDR, MULE transposase domain protein [Artemisia annua]|uniref:Transposase, MuDR, MULE transposase domain protein n=1 Tax=Artemisia annua TaxID=35608 RepID=A0A2U1PE94_ARTAN|nr:transposase, MuDR, MULE transposase domain protein [Artemisia annua]
MDTCSYHLRDLIEEAMTRYPSDRDLVLSVLFVDKYAAHQSFIELDSDEKFKMMLDMHEVEKEVTIYVTTENNARDLNEIQQSEESYYSHLTTDYENELPDYEVGTCLQTNKSPIMKVNSRFVNVVQFRRALNHYALMNEFEYIIEKSEPTRFTVRCANLKCKWNIHAYIMDDKVTFELKKLVEEHSCIRSNKGGNIHATQGWIANVVSDKLKSDGIGKEQAYTDTYGKWEDSFINIVQFKDEILNRNPGSIIDIDFESNGLEVAITQVYPEAEHRECVRHLYSNFKNNHGDFYIQKLWGAAKTYYVNVHDRLLNEIVGRSEEAITYLHVNHNKVWSRSKFGTTSKCDCITNNLSEAFNSWVGDLRYQPVLNLLDGIREMLMARFDKKRMAVRKWKRDVSSCCKNSSQEYLEVCRSSDNKAEVKHKRRRWEVVLDEKKMHLSSLASQRSTKFKEAYALEIAPLPTMDHWVHRESGEKIFPPVIKRPIGRPIKNRIVSHDESKRKKRCPRCHQTGHHEKTCKNSAPSKDFEESQASTSKS